MSCVGTYSTMSTVLTTTPEYLPRGVHNGWECFVDYHIRQEESYEDMAVLPNRLDLLCIAFLFNVRHLWVRKDGRTIRRAHGATLILRTSNWVSSKLIYPKGSPTNTQERMARPGMRHSKTIILVSESSPRLAGVRRTRPGSVMDATAVRKMEVEIEGMKSDTALMLAGNLPPFD